MMATPPRWSERRRSKTVAIIERDKRSDIVNNLFAVIPRWQHNTVLDLKGTFAGGTHSQSICLKCYRNIFYLMVSGALADTSSWGGNLFVDFI